MWKYKCKSQFLTLLGAFAAGFFISMFASGNDGFFSLVEETLPNAEAVSVLKSNPWLIGISGGLGFAGITNVFVLGNLVSSYFSGGSFLLLIAILMFPSVLMTAGIVLVPVSMIVFLYGWISLNMQTRQSLKKADITGDSEIVRIYLLHHPLLAEYEALAKETKKTVGRINFAYGLGLVAIFCAMFFINNIWLSMIALFVCLFAFQYLGRLKANGFMEISSLLVGNCDPEACMSALIYYGKRRNGTYKLPLRAVAARCMIYLNDPALAQDILISFQRSSPAAAMTYWSLMAYSYYLLKDENGVQRCRDELARIKTPMGAMGLMAKSEELASVENKLRLMQGDFNTCKKYYLELLKRSQSNLVKADCDYYIALISFVQEDYVVAKVYFQNTIRTGNKLYFVKNAKNYLAKIEEKEKAEEQLSIE